MQTKKEPVFALYIQWKYAIQHKLTLLQSYLRMAQQTIVQMKYEILYNIQNIDCTIILQAPHLNTYIKSMRKVISDICKIDIGMVSIKATTTDKLGVIGQGKGIGASAIVLLGKL